MNQHTAKTKNPFMKTMLVALFALTLFSCTKEVSSVPVQPASEQTNFQSSAVLPQQLAKGISLATWFTDWADATQYATRFTTTHLDTLKRLGFTYVRLPIGYKTLYQESNPSQLNPANIGYVDAAVQMILNAGLAVTIDYHPLNSDYEKELYFTDTKINELAAYWKSLASYFSKYSSQQVFFEVYNEPHYGQYELAKNADAWKWWWPKQEKLVQAIREVTSQHYIIVGAEGFNNIQYLTQATPYKQKNIIYNFHFYEPFIFTHQGATWTADAYKQLKNVPYPSTPDNVKSLVAASTNSEVKSMLTSYGNQRWNAAVIENKIKAVADWAQKNNVAVICNEFGAYKPYSPVASRSQYIQDVRTIFEKYQIGWAMWECDATFGLLCYPGAARTDFYVDANIKDALGL